MKCLRSAFALSLALTVSWLLRLDVAIAANAISVESPEGWLDLDRKQWQENLILTGPWDFFWGLAWTLEQSAWPLVEERVEIGRAWSEFVDLKTGAPRPASGVASYRLHITGLAARPAGYELRLRAADASLSIYREGYSYPQLRARATQGEARLRFFPDDPLAVWVVVVQRRQGEIESLWSVPRLIPQN